jgi:hypothetical protein
MVLVPEGGSINGSNFYFPIDYTDEKLYSKFTLKTGSTVLLISLTFYLKKKMSVSSLF